MMYKIFTYGTLKKGQANHHYLRGSEFLGKYYTGPGFRLEDNYLPFLYKDDNGKGCFGELYLVTPLTLELIDRLEGHPQWYKREEIIIHPLMEDTPKDKAWVYLMNKKHV